MRYIAKVNSSHVIEVNGKNVLVEETNGYLSYKGIVFNPVNGEVSANRQHLALIVLAVELAMFVIASNPGLTGQAAKQ